MSLIDPNIDYKTKNSSADPIPPSVYYRPNLVKGKLNGNEVSRRPLAPKLLPLSSSVAAAANSAASVAAAANPAARSSLEEDIINRFRESAKTFDPTKVEEHVNLIKEIFKNNRDQIEAASWIANVLQEFFAGCGVKDLYAPFKEAVTKVAIVHGNEIRIPDQRRFKPVPPDSSFAKGNVREKIYLDFVVKFLFGGNQKSFKDEDLENVFVKLNGLLKNQGPRINGNAVLAEFTKENLDPNIKQIALSLLREVFIKYRRS